MKFNNRIINPKEVIVNPETVTVEFRPVNTGTEVVMLPEDKDRYDGVPSAAYSLENELKEGIALEKCPTYIRLEKMYGSDVATRTVGKLRDLVDERNMQIARDEHRRALLNPAVPAAPAASAASAASAAQP